MINRRKSLQLNLEERFGSFGGVFEYKIALVDKSVVDQGIDDVVSSYSTATFEGRVRVPVIDGLGLTS